MAIHRATSVFPCGKGCANRPSWWDNDCNNQTKDFRIRVVLRARRPAERSVDAATSNLDQYCVNNGWYEYDYATSEVDAAINTSTRLLPSTLQINRGNLESAFFRNRG